MVRRVFFSFHYNRDVWRASIVRKSWVTKPDRKSAGFWDDSLWEEAKKKGDRAIKRMIDEGLKNTSVTAVLIGTQTSKRKYVKYEIKKSIEKGNGLLGIYIHNIKDKYGKKATKGSNPLSSKYKTYDWVYSRGYENLPKWVEEAAKQVGR